MPHTPIHTLSHDHRVCCSRIYFHTCLCYFLTLPLSYAVITKPARVPTFAQTHKFKPCRIRANLIVCSSLSFSQAVYHLLTVPCYAVARPWNTSMALTPLALQTCVIHPNAFILLGSFVHVTICYYGCLCTDTLKVCTSQKQFMPKFITVYSVNKLTLVLYTYMVLYSFQNLYLLQWLDYTAFQHI